MIMNRLESQAMEAPNSLLMVVLVLCAPVDMIAAGDNAPAKGVQEIWTKPSTEWVVHVRRYSRGWMLKSTNQKVNDEAQKPRVDCEFHMSITVLETQSEGEQRIARIQFTVLDDAPEFGKGTFVLEIDASTGAPKGLKKIAGRVGGSQWLEGDSGKRILFSDSPGFPTSWVVEAADLSHIPTAEQEHKINSEKSGLALVKILRPTETDGDKLRALQVEGALFYPFIEVAQVRVVQVWVPGEGWWRSYKSYVQGHIDLEATLVERKGE